MSNFLVHTVKPFRKDINQLPRLRYNTTDCPWRHMYGIRKARGDFCKVQYIPSDSPHGSYVWKPNTSDYTIDQMLYTLNKQGFRGDNFNKDDDAVMFLGCSYTFGTAVADEDVWCRNVAKRRNKKCWNLGVPGGGNQQIFLMADSFIESGYIPSEAVILWTEPLRKLLFHSSIFNKMAEQNENAREEFLEGNLQTEIDEFSPAWVHRELKFKDQESQKSWALMSEDHQWFDFHMHRSLVLNLFKAHNIPVIEMHIWPETAHFCQNIDKVDPWNMTPRNIVFTTPDKLDLGRDNMHWGPKTNTVAEDLYFKLLSDREG